MDGMAAFYFFHFIAPSPWTDVLLQVLSRVLRCRSTNDSSSSSFTFTVLIYKYLNLVRYGQGDSRLFSLNKSDPIVNENKWALHWIGSMLMSSNSSTNAMHLDYKQDTSWGKTEHWMVLWNVFQEVWAVFHCPCYSILFIHMQSSCACISREWSKWDSRAVKCSLWKKYCTTLKNDFQSAQIRGGK